VVSGDIRRKAEDRIRQSMIDNWSKGSSLEGVPKRVDALRDMELGIV